MAWHHIMKLFNCSCSNERGIHFNLIKRQAPTTQNAEFTSGNEEVDDDVFLPLEQDIVEVQVCKIILLSINLF